MPSPNRNYKQQRPKPMSNKNKTKSIEIPAAYQLLTLPLKKEGAERKIVIDPVGKIHCFPNKDAVIPPDITIDVEFKNFDDFLSRGNKNVLAWHEQLFKCEPPKKQNETITATSVWAYLIKEGSPHLEGIKSDGTKERKSSIAGRRYRKGTADPATTLIKTPQAQMCYKIFTDLLGNEATVTEEALKASVYARATELKTRQDAWRIFQYYRPTLIQAKLIAHD
jgi:hypothetical protein